MFDAYSEIFAERANAYHSAMRLAPDARKAEFRAVIEPIAAGPGLVCDMPAGGCYLARHLPPGFRYLGVEPVEHFLDLGAGVEGTTISAPITDVPLGDGSVDHVISLAGLHHEEDLPAVFREMRRLVRTGGRVVLADVAAGTAPARFLNGFVARRNPLGHNGCFLDEQTQTILEQAGLVTTDDGLVTVPWVFDSYRLAGEFCSGLFGIEGVSPEGVCDVLADEIGLVEAGGRIRLQWVLRRIVCEAR